MIVPPARVRTVRPFSPPDLFDNADGLGSLLILSVAVPLNVQPCIRK